MATDPCLSVFICGSALGCGPTAPWNSWPRFWRVDATGCVCDRRNESAQELAECLPLVLRQLLERPQKLVGRGRTKPPFPGFQVLQDLLYLADASGGFDLASSIHCLIHQPDIVQSGA